MGGVNEKIEGFFDVCVSAGLTGDQGVIIPVQNIENLMLKDEVVKACKEGQFAIYAVEHSDQAVKLMTGVPAGQINEKGRYASNTLYGKILLRLAKLRKDAHGGKKKKKSKKASKRS